MKRHLLALLLLSIHAVAVHSFFYVHTIHMVKFPSDATTQFMFYKYAIADAYANGQFFWSWMYGIGGDLLAQFNYYYSTAFIWLLALFGEYTSLQDVLSHNVLFAMLKVWLASIAMYGLLLYNRRSRLAALVAALLYSGSYVFAMHSFEFDFMVDAFVLLPFWIWAFTHFVVTRKPILYVLMTAVVLVNNFYFAYILTVYFMLYCAYKYFDVHGAPRWQSLWRYSRDAVLYYVVGMLLAAVVFVPAVYQFLSSDRLVKEHVVPLLYSKSFYENIPQLLFLSYNTTHSMGLALMAAVILLLGIVLLPNREYLPKKLFVLVLLVLFCIPYVYSVMNGFSAPQKRWLFVLAFTLSYVAGHMVDDVLRLPKRKWIIGGALVLTSMAVYIVVTAARHETYIDLDWRFAALTAVALIVCIVARRIVIVVTLLAVLVTSNVLHSYIYYDAIGAHYSETDYARYFDTAAFGNAEGEDIARFIQSRQATFSRTILPAPHFALNSGMYYGLKTNSAYQSLIPKNVHRFYKEHYNTFAEGSGIVSQYEGYDDRLYLEALMANEFKVLPIHERAPYYYERVYTTENYAVYQMPLHIQLGFGLPYEATVSTERFASLTMAERDQLALFGVVYEAAPTNEALLAQLETTSTAIDHAALQVEGGEWRDGALVITARQGTVTIPYTPQFEQGEVLIELHMHKELTETFNLTVDGETLYYPGHSIWNFPLQQLVVRATPIDGMLTLRLTEGRYEISSLRVVENSYAPFAKQVEALAKTALQDVTYTANGLRAALTVEQQSRYVLAIPYSKGWTVKVDGKPVPTYEVNNMLIGFDVAAGSYTIELAYVTPYVKLGLMLTLCACLLLLVISRRK